MFSFFPTPCAGPIETTPHDVLLGRGGQANSHPGNILFRGIVRAALPEYNKLSAAPPGTPGVKKNKTTLALSIVEDIRNRGGRFLSQGAGGAWKEVSEKDARRKASQALRDCNEHGDEVGAEAKKDIWKDAAKEEGAPKEVGYGEWAPYAAESLYVPPGGRFPGSEHPVHHGAPSLPPASAPLHYPVAPTFSSSPVWAGPSASSSPPLPPPPARYSPSPPPARHTSAPVMRSRSYSPTPARRSVSAPLVPSYPPPPPRERRSSAPPQAPPQHSIPPARQPTLLGLRNFLGSFTGSIAGNLSSSLADLIENTSMEDDYEDRHMAPSPGRSPPAPPPADPLDLHADVKDRRMYGLIRRSSWFSTSDDRAKRHEAPAPSGPLPSSKRPRMTRRTTWSKVADQCDAQPPGPNEYAPLEPPPQRALSRLTWGRADHAMVHPLDDSTRVSGSPPERNLKGGLSRLTTWRGAASAIGMAYPTDEPPRARSSPPMNLRKKTSSSSGELLSKSAIDLLKGLSTTSFSFVEGLFSSGMKPDEALAIASSPTSQTRSPPPQASPPPDETIPDKGRQRNFGHAGRAVSWRDTRQELSELKTAGLTDLPLAPMAPPPQASPEKPRRAGMRRGRSVQADRTGGADVTSNLTRRPSLSSLFNMSMFSGLSEGSLSLFSGSGDAGTAADADRTADRDQSMAGNTNSEGADGNPSYHRDIRTSHVRHHSNSNVFLMYSIVDKIGTGNMGCVYKVRKKNKSPPPSSAERDFALKLINLDSFSGDGGSYDTVRALRNEIDVLKELDHPNILRAFETHECIWEGNPMLAVVMEYCSGGNLYTRPVYSETDAARILHELLSAVAYMHSKNVMHRDLKYENIMFESTSWDSEIKIIDFGLSKKYLKGEVLKERAGTVHFMSPQVLRGVYTNMADIWSVGVIAFMLLSSTKPFSDDRSIKELIRKISGCEYNFNARAWKLISPEAKDFVSSLLRFDPGERPTAAEALQLSFLKRRSSLQRPPSIDLLPGFKKKKHRRTSSSQLKRSILMDMAHNSDDLLELRRVFREIDQDNDGTITYEEFNRVFFKGQAVTEPEKREMFNNANYLKNGRIAYTEFLAFALEYRGEVEENKILDTFRRMDVSNSGFISQADIQDFLQCSEETSQRLIEDADFKSDGKISYGEFLMLMRGKQEKVKEKIIGGRSVEDLKEVDMMLSLGSFEFPGGRNGSTSY